MADNSTSRTLVLLAALGILAWWCWLVRDVLPPFLIAGALALLLDPLLDRIQHWGLPRAAAVALTFLAFMAGFVAVIAFLLPRAVSQVAELTANLDRHGLHLEMAVDSWAARNAVLLERLGLPTNVADLWSRYQVDIMRSLQAALQKLFNSLQASVGMLGWLVVVPIVTLYLMIDLDGLKARLLHLVSPRHREMVGELAAQVGRVFGAYIRGLVAVCAAFGFLVYLDLAFLFRVPYAVILGLLAVVLYAVPYLGQLALLLVSILVAWVTGARPGTLVGLAASLLLVGQLFDQLITPRVIGKQVGLHPVLGLFALMVGGHLFGLGGMVVAVPIAASARVVLVHLFPRLAEPIPGAALAPAAAGELKAAPPAEAPRA